MNDVRCGNEVRDQRGQMSVMIVGFALVIMLAIAAVTDASAAYLQHSGLDTVADGAALAGAKPSTRN